MAFRRNILVVDDEVNVLGFFKDGLSIYRDRFNVHTAMSGKDALKILRTTKVDLVVTDLHMPQMNGFELIAHMSKNYRDIPVITMTAFGSPQIKDKAKQMGSVHFLEKPLSLDSLVEKISEALGPKSKGFVHGVTLPTFLQMVGHERKSCTLEITSEDKLGHLYVKGGKLIDAKSGNLRGQEAAIEIILWNDPEIHIHDGCVIGQKHMDASITYVLLEAARVRDERSDGPSPFYTDELLEKAIKLAEGCRFREAQAYLAKLLKHDRRNHMGWLWYSRIAGSMKSIEAALKNAELIAGKEPEIIEEIKKLGLAAKEITEDRVRRCPFCWSPVSLRTFQCQYCQAHMSLRKEFFSSPKYADRDILLRAIARYRQVKGLEKNMLANYYLGMAYLNLEDWEDGLNHLDRSVKLGPEKQSLTNQLRMLLDYMASLEVKPVARKPRPEGGLDPYLTTEDEGKPKRILVVEDSSTTRKVITITLNQHNYEVVEAKDGLEALSKVNEIRPDLILLDILLPKMDGYKILNILKNSPQLKQIPVIMLTSKDGFIDKVKGKLAGSTEYLTKPFDPKQLVRTVEKYL
jgi:twitching motility two-component system response regulator PilG